MSNAHDPEIRKLLGGYATRNLTEAEEKALWEAALQDQELFNAMADEQALRELLERPGVKRELLTALEKPPTVWERMKKWFASPVGWGVSGVAVATAVLAVVMVPRFVEQHEPLAASSEREELVTGERAKVAPPVPQPQRQPPPELDRGPQLPAPKPPTRPADSVLLAESGRRDQASNIAPPSPYGVSASRQSGETVQAEAAPAELKKEAPQAPPASQPQRAAQQSRAQQSADLSLEDAERRAPAGGLARKAEMAAKAAPPYVFQRRSDTGVFVEQPPQAGVVRLLVTAPADARVTVEVVGKSPVIRQVKGGIPTSVPETGIEVSSGDLLRLSIIPLPNARERAQGFSIGSATGARPAAPIEIRIP